MNAMHGSGDDEDNIHLKAIIGKSMLVQKLFDTRTILICGEINSAVAYDVMAQTLALAAMSDDDITVYVHSNGGHVESGDTIHDVFTFVKPRIRMIGTGW